MYFHIHIHVNIFLYTLQAFGFAPRSVLKGRWLEHVGRQDDLYGNLGGDEAATWGTKNAWEKWTAKSMKELFFVYT